MVPPSLSAQMDDISQKLGRVLGSLVDYRIKFDLIVINADKDKLGQGAYGDVWLGELVSENGNNAGDGPAMTRSMAVKTLRQATGNKHELMLTACQLARELKVWAGLLHPNILELVGFCLSDTLEKAWLLSPYEPEGNLAEFMEKKRPDQGRKMELVFDALCGLRYLHSHSPTIVHGDLKPENIIIGRDGFAKLCDFGLAKALDEPTGLTKAGPTPGTFRYMSPELFDEDAAATLASDIWAFACVTCEVLTGQAPYHLAKSPQAILMQIMKGKDPIPLNRFALPTEMEAWIRRCWDAEADERPSASDCFDCLKLHLEANFSESSRLLQCNDLSLAGIPSQTDDFLVERHREKLMKQPTDHPERSENLTNLAHTLMERFKAHGKLADLEEAITLHRQALQLRPAGHPTRHSSLWYLTTALVDVHLTLEDGNDTNEMVTLCREALQLCPPSHEEHPANVALLGLVLYMHFCGSQDQVILDESIMLHRKALQLLPSGCSFLNDGLTLLSNLLQLRFNTFGDVKDLDDAVVLRRKALGLSPVGHPQHFANLSELAKVLSLSAKQSLDQAVSTESIALFRHALQLCPLGHTDHPLRLRSLALELKARFDMFGDVKDLEEAIECRREALCICPAGHPERARSIGDLAAVFLHRSQTYGNPEDVTEFVDLERQRLELHPVGHPHHSNSLNQLGWALYKRFELLQKDSDLEEAIRFLREGVNLCPPDDPGRGAIVDSLGCALRSNFKRYGDLKDLTEAVKLLREAVQHLEIEDDGRDDTFENLGTALVDSYQSGGEAKDIDEAVELHLQALQLRPGHHPYHYDGLLALGNSLRARGGTGDLEEARRLYAEALELVHEDQPGNLRRQKLARKLMDEMGPVVVNEAPAVVNDVAQQLEEVTLKDE